jgi:hypothetical protein
MNLNFRPTVEGFVEPSIEEMVFAYFYRNLSDEDKDRAEELTKEYFEALDETFQ